MAEEPVPQEEPRRRAYALTPAGLSYNTIDYGTKTGLALYRQATDKLADELFDCVADDLRHFLELVQRRSEEMGWDNSVLTVAKNPEDPLGPSDDFFAHYGEFSMEKLRAVVQTYIPNECRVSQDSMQLYHIWGLSQGLIIFSWPIPALLRWHITLKCPIRL